MTVDLARLGWDVCFEAHFAPFKERSLLPGRVVREDRTSYVVLCGEGAVTAELTGSFRHEAAARGDFPAVGDWAVVKILPDEQRAMIHGLLPRKSAFTRKAAGFRTDEQVAAANVDTVFLVSGLDGDFNLRRMERYLAVAHDSGADPIIVLNKADLCDDVEERVAQAGSVAVGVPVLPMSAAEMTGLDALLPYLGAGETVAFLGSSGVGKSTLINRLLGEKQLATAPVSEYDGRGRHTTAHRELIRLPQGGVVIDTPGMRELHLWTEGRVPGGFQDIEELARQCHFSDCGHGSEPGCAVKEAISDGRLATERLANYHRLERELSHLEKRQAQKARMADRAGKSDPRRRKAARRPKEFGGDPNLDDWPAPE
ncbi:MAG: ribosome small subunit-dependent GTPase A [Planctomycetota bacterium]|jgi:ribosome biogenesis GTPase